MSATVRLLESDRFGAFLRWLDGTGEGGLEATCVVTIRHPDLPGDAPFYAKFYPDNGGRSRGLINEIAGFILADRYGLPQPPRACVAKLPLKKLQLATLAPRHRWLKTLARSRTVYPAFCTQSVQAPTPWQHFGPAAAAALLTWLENHRNCLDVWPANVLFDRLRAMLADGILDDEEQGDLLGLVLSISRPRAGNEGPAAATLPLDQPPPTVRFADHSFCFTGVFDFGTRNDCQNAVTQRGATAAAGVTKKLDYLVIGNVGSETWRHSSFGAKIAKAVEYRDNGSPVAIISEAHWMAALDAPPPD